MSKIKADLLKVSDLKLNLPKCQCKDCLKVKQRRDARGTSKLVPTEVPLDLQSPDMSLQQVGDILQSDLMRIEFKLDRISKHLGITIL